MNSETIQIVVFSKQYLFRQGIIDSLSKLDDSEVISASEFDDETLANLDKILPDVAIIDLDGPDKSGLLKTRQLKQRLPNIGIIALTSNYNDMQIFEALKSQASACLDKEVTAEQLIETVRRVAKGEHPINETLVTHPILADQVLRQFQELSRQKNVEKLLSPLTSRETEILDYLAQGLMNKQIADRLGISEQTIKNHVTSLLRKLNANARTEAVIIGLKQGLISLKVKN